MNDLELESLLETRIKKSFFSTDGINLHYIEAGVGKSVVLLHGLNIGIGQWYNNIKHLSSFCNIVAIDLPNSGYSDTLSLKKISKDPKLIVRIVDEFIEYLKLKEVSIIGHSFGGLIAMQLGLKNPTYLKKIVTIDSMGFTNFIPLNMSLVSSKRFVKILKDTVFRPEEVSIRRFLESVMSRKNIMSEDFVRYYTKVVQNNHIHPLDFMNALSKKGKIKNQFVLSSDELRKIKKPILTIFGKHDPLFPLKEVKESIKRLPFFEVKILKNSGHVPFIEEPEEFNKTLKDFINK